MSSPFKFLDAFEQADKAIFFGRDAETEQLYRLVFEASLVLVYGQLGTGKSSLIQCGLANRFAPTDWFQLFVRRGDDINVALDRDIRGQAVTPIEAGATPVEAIRSLYLDHLRPIYLIFDQFEELFVLGSKEEQDAFFDTVAAILSSDVSCRIIISLREEYLASLHRFEQAVPSLFNKRLRIEPMSMTNVEQVIIGTTDALGIRLEHGKATARRIIDQLDDGRDGVQLAYLQVYLDALYQRTAPQRGNGPVVFTDAAVDETGKLGDIMVEFLAKQTAAIEADVAGLPRHGVQHLLEQFVTVDGTKQPNSRAELADRMPDAAPWIDAVLGRLQKARILRDVGDRWELAHDALASRIAENCSGELKAMQMVQKVVRDGHARNLAFPTKRKWLSAEDLALVNRSRRLEKERPGAPRLELTPDELKFVKKSASRLRWRKFGLIAIISTVLMVILILLFSVGEMLVQDEDKAINTTNENDWLAYRAYSLLKDNPDPGVAALRVDLLQAEARLNTNREWGLGELDQALDKFWWELSEADLAAEAGNPAAQPDADPEALAGQRAAAKREYDRLEKIWQDELDRDPANLRARVRLKAILWRQNSYSQDKVAGAKMMKRLIALITPLDAYGEVDFSHDLYDACVELPDATADDPDCKALLAAQ